MSKYMLKIYPRDRWKFRVYDNVRKLEPAEIIRETGCTDLANLGYFSLTDFSHQCAVMIDGKWENPPKWDYPGICISEDGIATVGGTKDAACDYVASAQADYIEGKRTSTKKWDKNGWSAPRGYLAYTSAPGNSASRNLAAKKILEAVKSAGITIWSGGLAHEAWYVCKNVTAPAVLIEHGFHTNKEETALLKTAAYREKLAQADCRGVLSYLGIAWQPKAGAWYDESRKWAMERGISDGTRPGDPALRAEIWEMLRRVEASTKSAHHRLDELREEMEKA